MPRFLDSRELESCLSTSEAMEIGLDEPVDEALIRRLGREGSLQYFPRFPRPYFRVDHPANWVVQGIVGAAKLRIQLFGNQRADVLERLRCLIEG